MNKTKILHIVNDFAMGGVSSVLLDLVKNHKVSNFNYEIVNLSGKGDKSVVEQFNLLNIKIYNFNYQFSAGYSLLNQFEKAFLKKKFLKKNEKIITSITELKSDILHFHTLPRELMLGHAIQKNSNCKLVYTDHLTRVKLIDIKKISKILLPIPFQSFYKGYYVIAVGTAVEKYLMALSINKVTKNIVVINNKLSENNYRIHYVDKETYKVVYVARISTVKGHLDLIQAWSQLPPLNLNLFIIGPDELYGTLQEMVKALNLENKITFTGCLNNVSEFIKDADIGVFPSHKEGLPIALLEKMQIGIPCVVSDIEELTYIVSHNINGLVFKCGDSEDLADKIITLAKDIDLRRSIGCNAARLIKDEYVSIVGGLDKEYEAYYETVVIK